MPESDPSATIPPFAITHPLGYEREGGKIAIPVCVSSDDPSLIAPTQRAIDTWNALTATTQNCLGCRVWEEPAPGGEEAFHAESVILHELGHCAMGLGHINMPFDEDDDGMHEPRSFTRSSDTIDIDIGPDGIRGSFDDDHFEPPPPPGNRADSVSWFRKADNDPVIVDGTVIDTDTYSRSVATNLPSGHSWSEPISAVSWSTVRSQECRRRGGTVTRYQAMLAGFVFAASSTLPQPSSAGPFAGIAKCDDMLGCFAGIPECSRVQLQ